MQKLCQEIGYRLVLQLIHNIQAFYDVLYAIIISTIRKKKPCNYIMRTSVSRQKAQLRIQVNQKFILPNELVATIRYHLFLLGLISSPNLVQFLFLEFSSIFQLTGKVSCRNWRSDTLPSWDLGLQLQASDVRFLKFLFSFWASLSFSLVFLQEITSKFV